MDFEVTHVVTGITFMLGMALCTFAGIRVDLRKPRWPLSDHNQYALTMLLLGLVFIQIGIGRELGNSAHGVFSLDNVTTAILRASALISTIVSCGRLMHDRSGHT